MAIGGIVNQFVNTFKKLSMLQRVSLLAATVAVFATVVVLILWANKPLYKTLYTELPEDDVKAVTEALDAKGTPYTLLDGTTIEVPADDVYTTRMALALEGLPNIQTTGFELFDTSGWGKTEKEQNVSYLRALQGELARSIMAIDAITEARVHLSLAKERIFVDEEEQSSASVIIRILPGQTLSNDQITAITHLVSSSVDKMDPTQVQVIDSNGTLLTKFMTEEADPTLIDPAQLDLRISKEKEIVQKIRSVLSTSVGYDKYLTSVNIEMDFNKKESVTEAYSDPQPRSQYSLEITNKEQGMDRQGIPGVESNLAEPDLFINNIMRDYAKTETTVNNELTKVVTQETKVGGVIKRMTVSVVVDDKPMPVEDENGVRSLSKQPRSAEELAQLQRAVASAVGADTARGDVVEIVNVAFDTSEEWLLSGVSAEDERMQFIEMGAKYIAAVIILLVFYLVLVRPILKRLDKAQELDEEMLGESAIDAQLSGLDIAVGSESGFPKTVEELEREIESELDESVPVDVEAVKSKVMLKKIEEASNEDPEMIANLVKAMIKGN
jgi:flagellar M-ring protein FliF